jgi:DHA2 family multidrug resistance protein-like MFS transporter
VLAAFGIALPMAVTMNLMMVAAPPEKAGSVASISETSGEFGIAVGIAALGSLGTFVYRHQLPDTVPAVARESITAAVAAAQRVPGRLGTELLDGARAAFTGGLDVVAATGGAIFLALAVVAAVALRRASAPTAPAATDAQAAEPEPVCVG